MRIFEFFIAFGVVLVEVTSASPAGPLKDGRLARRAGGGLTPPPSPGDLRGYPTDIWNPPQNLRTIYLYKNFRPAPHDPRYPFGPSELDPKMKRPYDLYMEAVNVCMDNKWVEYCLFSREHLFNMLKDPGPTRQQIANLLQKADFKAAQNIAQQCRNEYFPGTNQYELEKYCRKAPTHKEELERDLSGLAKAGEQGGQTHAMVVKGPEKAMQRTWGNLVKNGKAAVGKMQLPNIGLPSSLSLQGAAAAVQRSVANRPKVVRLPV